MISQTILLAHQLLQPDRLETIRAILAEYLPGSQLVYQLVDRDEQTNWEKALIQLIDRQGVLLILTIGGIGPVGCVPDATKVVCHKLFSGFGTILRNTAKRSPASSQAEWLLWCNTAGLRNQTLIVNLPDHTEAIRAGLPLLFPAIPNAIRLARG